VADDRDATERALEFLVYAPVGFALYLRDNAPMFLRMFATRGRGEVDQRRHTVGDQVEDSLDQARALVDQVAVGNGAQLLTLVNDGLEALRTGAEAALRATRRDPEHAPDAPVAGRDDAGEGSGLASAGLGIRDYDALSASEIVDRLEACSATQLEAIRAHERAGRARSTVLGKIDQLTRPQ